MKLLYLVMALTSLIPLGHAGQYLCVKKQFTESETLAEQAKLILNKIDPEYNSLCQGLSFKEMNEMADASDQEVKDNFKVWQKFMNVSLYPKSKSEYCSRTPMEMVRHFCVNKGKLGFDNKGGLLGLPTGVCWWQSRFHRQVNYLTYFNPTKKTDYSDEETEEIIKRISNNKVAEIDGYNNFQDFLQDPAHPGRVQVLKKHLQKEMGKSTLRFEWLRGLKGKANVARKRKVSARKLDRQRQKQLQEIAKIKEMLINEKKTPYMMVQHPGPASHSFIVYDYLELEDPRGKKAFKIKVQDPVAQNGGTSFSSMDYVFDVEEGQWFTTIEYRNLLEKRDNPSLPEPKSQDWTLWNQHNDDMELIDQAFIEECGHSLFN